jgi:glutathione S-transferase
MSAQQKGLTLWYAPNTRCFRILWLLEELGLAYQLERVEFIPPAKTLFQQNTPTGKFPTPWRLAESYTMSTSAPTT